MDEDGQPERFARFTATFAPLRADDLREGAEAWVGRLGEWEALWLIDEDDGGDYVGQMACGWANLADRPPFLWVPFCDLVTDDAAMVSSGTTDERVAVVSD